MRSGQTEEREAYLEHIASNFFEQSFQTFEAKVDKSLSVTTPIVTADVDQVAFTEGVPTARRCVLGSDHPQGHAERSTCTRTATSMVTMYELGESCHPDFNAARPGERTITRRSLFRGLRQGGRVATAARARTGGAGRAPRRTLRGEPDGAGAGRRAGRRGRRRGGRSQ